MLTWVDIETTGLLHEQDQILEVAALVTDNELREVAASSWVLHYDLPALPDSRVNAYVREMHAKNKLWDECAVSSRSAADVEQELLTFLRQYTERGTTPCCGSSVAFDRAFLRRYMPQAEAHFHYRSVDVSTLGELASRWYPEVNDRKKAEAHRALPDIRESVEYLRFLRARVMR